MTRALALVLLLACSGSAADDAVDAPLTAPDAPALAPTVDAAPPDAGPLDARVCPAEGESPLDGFACSAPEGTRCPSLQPLVTCSGDSAGYRTCTCEDGTWFCPNTFCARYCPATLEEALAGPACQGEPREGVCYYDGRLCSCHAGAVSCG
jgi:hypothetical protein